MAQQTRSNLNTTITNTITTNGNKEITGQDLREILIDLTDSYINKGGDNGVSSITFISGNGIDVDASVGTDTLNIGTTGADIINIGRSGATVNILGSTLYEDLTNTVVKDKLITLNKSGAAGSATGSGFEFEEDSIITGYFKTNAGRTAFELKTPATAGIATLITPAANQSYTFPAATGTIALTIDLAGYQPLDSTLTAIAAYNTNGILTQTAEDNFVGRTITGTANEVEISNGNGVSGNPTIGLPDDVIITTSLTTPTVMGSSASGGDLTLSSTSHATKGDILLGDTGEVEKVGIGITSSLTAKLHLRRRIGGGATAENVFQVDVNNFSEAFTIYDPISSVGYIWSDSMNWIIGGNSSYISSAIRFRIKATTTSNSQSGLWVTDSSDNLILDVKNGGVIDIGTSHSSNSAKVGIRGLGNTSATRGLWIKNLAGDEIFQTTDDRNMSFLVDSMFGSGVGVFAIGNAITNPSTNPTNAIINYVDAADGFWKYRDENGNVITI